MPWKNAKYPQNTEAAKIKENFYNLRFINECGQCMNNMIATK